MFPRSLFLQSLSMANPIGEMGGGEGFATTMVEFQTLGCFMEKIWYLKKYCLQNSKSPFLTWCDSINYTIDKTKE